MLERTREIGRERAEELVAMLNDVFNLVAGNDRDGRSPADEIERIKRTGPSVSMTDEWALNIFLSGNNVGPKMMSLIARAWGELYGVGNVADLQKEINWLKENRERVTKGRL